MKISLQFILSLFPIFLTAQNFQVSTYNPTPKTFQFLLEKNNVIGESTILNELVVDLVSPILLDSTIERKKQHHKLGPIGFFASTIWNFNWRAIDSKKEKMVGTIMRNPKSSEIQFTEYDINFDLEFHLDKYLNRMFDMYDTQGEIKRRDIRKSHRKNYTKAPFVRDTNNIDIRQYRLHCELTPEHKFIEQLNSFYPTIPNSGGLNEHPNFGTKQLAAGFYGTLCLDCNHSCHPEMHPYEWMWWLKCAEGDTSKTKEWHIGLFHEGSNRMKKWSKNPLVGEIKIPFTFNENDSSIIEVEHGIYGAFVEEEINKLNMPSNTFLAVNCSIVLEGHNIKKEIELRVKNSLNTEGLKYWVSDINYDSEEKIISGYFNYAVSVEDVYTCTIKFL